MHTTTSYFDLRVWKSARQFIRDIYAISGSFPESERYGMTSQLRRAAVSIAANITEGKGRSSAKDFANFLITAKGSANECQLYCLLANDLGYIDKPTAQRLSIDLDRMIVGLENLIRHLRH